jgi:peptidoglycan/xylan/chitin deacetylase (PgdA/CDA1 family)
MKFWLAQKLLRLGDRLKARFIPGAIILLYHRVTDLRLDPQLLAVAPHHFEQHLEILRREYQPMSLGAFVDALHNKRFPKRTVIVTMDDGYADNLYEAKPLLEQFNVPATVFVTVGSIGSRREFWWDELERVFLHSYNLPDALSLRIDGVERQYNLGHTASYGSDRLKRYAHWNVESSDDPTERHAVYRSLIGLLRGLSAATRHDLLERILVWARADREGRPTHRTLTAEELLCLVDGGLVKVGAHGVSHSALALLSQEEQKAEILGSKIRLEGILGSKVDQFAYPFGSRNDYTQETTALVQDVGFMSACANYPGLVWSSRNRYEWPRILVRDWDGEEFSQRLRRWSSG